MRIEVKDNLASRVLTTSAPPRSGPGPEEDGTADKADNKDEE